MNIRKTVTAITLIMVLTLPGCSALRNAKKDSPYSSKEKQRAYLEDRSEEIVELINGKDKKGLKALFSDKALDRTDDIDEGIDYLMDAFEDIEITGDVKWADFTEVTPYVWHIFSCTCEVETSEGKMTLGFKDIPIMDYDDSYNGLYSVVIADDDDQYRYFAGVYTPDMDDIADTIEFINAQHVRTTDYDDYLKDNLSSGLKKKLDDDEWDALGYFLAVHPRQYVEWTMKDGDNRYHFIELLFSSHYYVFCVGIDEDDPDKICHVSAMEYERGDVPSSKEVIKAGLDDIVDLYEEKN